MYHKAKPGEWIKPKRKGYKMACCDCGLVHRVDFIIVHSRNKKLKQIQFRAYRDERATGQLRRQMKNRGELK